MRVIVTKVIAILVVVTSLAVSPARGADVPPAARPTDVVGQAGCVRAECHVDIKDYAQLHGPVAVNACDACHVLADPESHTFEMARDGAEMCTYCHEYDISGMPVVHEPVTKGECLGCHDPHGGTVLPTLRETSVPELCGRCHESVTHGKSFLHAPVREGACTSCHPPHASRLPKLVDVAGPDLCLACHTGFDERLSQVLFPHEAMKQGCVKCHDVHGAGVPMALVQPPVELCLGCHDEVKTELASADVTHSPVTNDRACMTCHTPHGGDLGKLMAELPVRVCMDCHDEPVSAEGGRVVPAVAGVMDPNTVKHGPIKDGQCGGCHSAHGGERGLLLARELSDRPHQRFSLESYELCFNCHDPKLATSASAGDVTGFRDGDWNLHYVHVASGDDRGRNCLLCHDSHATVGEKIVRADVHYGQWTMPVGFTKTDTGGTCLPGCHVEFRYDRQTPALATTRPSVPQMPTVARAERAGIIELDLTATDAVGLPVRVPDSTRPTVLLLVRAGNEQTDEAIRLAKAAIGDVDAQVITVLSGEGAQDGAGALLSGAGSSWAVLTDADNQVAEALGVRGWPMTIVVQPDGAEVARISGAPESLALKLAPYVRLAAGEIDAAGIDEQLLKPQVITDALDRKAERHWLIADRLLAQGKPAEAERVVIDGLKHHPDSVPLRVGMVSVYTALGRGKEAIGLLDGLPNGSIPQDQELILRGRAMITVGQWTEARELLTAAVERDPSLSEAHYLLGEIYTHEQDWERAARSYRAVHAATVPR